MRDRAAIRIASLVLLMTFATSVVGTSAVNAESAVSIPSQPSGVITFSSGEDLTVSAETVADDLTAFQSRSGTRVAVLVDDADVDPLISSDQLAQEVDDQWQVTRQPNSLLVVIRPAHTDSTIRVSEGLRPTLTQTSIANITHNVIDEALSRHDENALDRALVAVGNAIRFVLGDPSAHIPTIFASSSASDGSGSSAGRGSIVSRINDLLARAAFSIITAAVIYLSWARIVVTNRWRRDRAYERRREAEAEE